MPATRNIASTKRIPNNEKVDIIIPAAGLGNRMKAHGPKSLIEIADTDIISHQLKVINTCIRNKQIIVVAGFEAAKVMNTLPEDIIKIENENFQETNVVRSIGMGLRASLAKHVLIIYGDLVFNTATLKFPLGLKSFIVTDSSGLMKDSEVGCITNNSLVEQMFFELPNKWAQIVYLTGKELAMCKSIAWNKNKQKLFGFELINAIIKKGGKINVVSPKNIKITDVDSTSDIPVATKIIQGNR